MTLDGNGPLFAKRAKDEAPSAALRFEVADALEDGPDD